MPFEHNPRFTGRKSKLSRLENLLSHTSRTTKIAITGLGGVSTTQRAIELGHQAIEERKDCLVFGIPATDPENLHQAYLASGNNIQVDHNIAGEFVNLQQFVGEAHWHKNPRPRVFQCPCSCLCHRSSLCQLRLFNEWLGSFCSLVTGTLSCHQCICESGQKYTMTYYFPRWLSFEGLFLSLTRGNRIYITISIPRIVAPDSEIFKCIRAGDCERIKHLLVSEKASVADILSPWGYTTLTTALLYDQQEVAEFLIHQGVSQIDPRDYRKPSDLYDHFQSWSLLEHDVTASGSMFDSIKFMSANWHSKSLKWYTELNMLQRLQLSRLHNAVFGISCENVSAAALACKDDIDNVDALGRTALYCAAIMQDETAVRTLLFYRADPTKPDHYGVSPLHIAAAVGSVGCVQELIDGGAVIEQQDCFGAPAAHYATTTGSISVLEVFLQENQDPNIQTYLKEPLLNYANHAFQLETVKFLLEHGASTTLQDQWGYDAISDAVFSDAHDVLLYFADQALISRNCLLDGKTILHIAALNSDIRTIAILSRFTYLEVDPHARDNAGHTAVDYIRRRPDSDRLLGPFCALLLKAEADNMWAKLPSHQEAGALDSEEEIYFDALEDLSFRKFSYIS